MASLNRSKTLMITLIVLGTILTGALPKNVLAQDCGCSPDLCCNQYGYCDTTEPYCGAGCLEGPCYGNPSILRTPSNNSGSVGDIVTPEFFSGILNKAPGDCPGKSFYTRDAFLNAASAKLYKDLCNQLCVAPGPNLTC